MPAYAIAVLRQVQLNDEIAQYIRRIDATLVPYGGAFKIHGAQAEVLEGTWDGALIVIGFPDMARARQWYQSEAYQAILGLRTRNAEGVAFLVEGVEEGYQGAQMLAKLKLG